MDFSFTEEQSMLRDTVASYLADHYDFDKRRAAVSKEPGWRPEVWKAFAEELRLEAREALAGFGNRANRLGELADFIVLRKF